MIYGGERKMELRRVNDIIADYPGEWVAVEVLEYDSRDPNGDKDYGRLVAHSVDRDEVRDAMSGYTSLIAFEYSGPQIEPGYVITL